MTTNNERLHEAFRTYLNSTRLRMDGTVVRNSITVDSVTTP